MEKIIIIINKFQMSYLEEGIFSTFDIGLATVLSLSFPIECLDKNNPKKVEFLFKRQPGLDEAIQAYWAKALSIEPQALFANLKYLKNRIYSN